MLRKLHFSLAIFLLLFIISHLAVHFSALWGPEVHLMMLESVRPMYQNRIVEPILLTGLLGQVILGIKLALKSRSGEAADKWAKLQIVSGIYLGFFIIMHSTAAVTTRLFFDVDTNFWWAAGTLYNDILKWGFMPYYFFAVTALFVHLASALHFRWPKRKFPTFLAVGGAVYAALIVATFAGVFYPIPLPAGYVELFDGYVSAMGLGE